MKAKKRFGQNFLIDNNIIYAIVKEVDATVGDLVIEIGPGRGALTSKIKEKKCNIIAYEIDEDLKDILKEIEDEKVKIIFKDFLNSDIKSDLKNYDYNNLFIVGNLPYYITTPIIEHIINQKIDFKRFTIMVQKEVAERFLAQPKSKDYGYMTLLLKFFFVGKKVCDVSRNCFNPAPKVESTVLSFEKRKDIPKIDSRKYFNFLKDVFKQKRKTLKNNLKDYNLDLLIEFLKDNNIPETIRAEELTEELLIKLFNKLT